MNKVKVRVAFQGERGAYSEEAAVKYFGEGVELLPNPTMVDVFKAVEEGSANYAVVPLENSIEGSVGEVLDLLTETDLSAVGEVIIKIVHCLIANPGDKLENIREVYSHPQALGQCRRFLTAKGWRLIPVYDTAGSLRLIRGRRGSAAIASKRAAQIYGMEVLLEGIEDNPMNYTRFLVLARPKGTTHSPTGDDKTSILFKVKHVPGALYRALEEFAIRNINLTKIESRPVKGSLWEYFFYVDFEGHVQERRVKEALEALKKKTTYLKVLGSYARFSAPV